MYAAISAGDVVRIVGIQRIRLLEGMLRYADRLLVYQGKGGEGEAGVANFGKMRLTLAL